MVTSNISSLILRHVMVPQGQNKWRQEFEVGGVQFEPIGDEWEWLSNCWTELSVT
ncbi:hypothetical protein LguiB_008953 [Lonicera macranthoides]